MNPFIIQTLFRENIHFTHHVKLLLLVQQCLLHRHLAIGEVAVGEPACTGNGATEAGRLFLNTFTFSSSKQSSLPIYCRVNRVSVRKLHSQAVFEPSTFSTSGECSNHLAIAPLPLLLIQTNKYFSLENIL